MLLLFDVKRLFISSIAFHDIEIYGPNNSNLQAIHLVIVIVLRSHSLTYSSSLCLFYSIQQNNCNENAANQLPFLTNIKHIFGFAVFVGLSFIFSHSLLFSCHPELRLPLSLCLSARLMNRPNLYGNDKISTGNDTANNTNKSIYQLSCIVLKMEQQHNNINFLFLVYEHRMKENQEKERRTATIGKDTADFF